MKELLLLLLMHLKRLGADVVRVERRRLPPCRVVTLEKPEERRVTGSGRRSELTSGGSGGRWGASDVGARSGLLVVVVVAGVLPDPCFVSEGVDPLGVTYTLFFHLATSILEPDFDLKPRNRVIVQRFIILFAFLFINIEIRN